MDRTETPWGRPNTETSQRQVLWLVVVTLAVVAVVVVYLEPWGFPSGTTLEVYNNDQNEQVVVRVHTAEGPVDWLLQPNQIETLLNQDHAIPGPIELLDPTTCEVLVRAELPEGPGLFGVTGRGSTPEGVETGWTLSVAVADRSDDDGIDPNFTACPHG